MLIEKKPAKKRKLSHEILCLIGLSALIALLLFLLLTGIATAVAESYCFQYDIPMTEFDWIHVDQWIFSVSAILSCITFSILFLSMLHDRIAYIRILTEGISQLHTKQTPLALPLKGKNELTELAEAINTLSEAQLQLREKETALAREKEQLIRTLSHDIRTPLTAIMSVTEYLSTRNTISPQEQTDYLQLVQKKAGQIRELTGLLLDGSKRNLEDFPDARLLMEQLAAEFEETVEDRFSVSIELSACMAFRGRFDVQELRRIFDNLSSNVLKYADPAQPVSLSVSTEKGRLVICQRNGVMTPKPQSESFQIGLNSIRRLVQLYDGQVLIGEEDGQFSVTVFMPI